ncbi:MAG TPA: hypothetical protein VGG04_18970 [Candidatus Sulfotelmatobacter sp.]|jgi:hypothetical protein
MKRTRLAHPCEQRKVDKLLLKLIKLQAIAAKPAPIKVGQSALRTV